MSQKLWKWSKLFRSRRPISINGLSIRSNSHLRRLTITNQTEQKLGFPPTKMPLTVPKIIEKCSNRHEWSSTKSFRSTAWDALISQREKSRGSPLRSKSSSHFGDERVAQVHEWRPYFFSKSISPSCAQVDWFNDKVRVSRSRKLEVTPLLWFAWANFCQALWLITRITGLKMQ